MKPEVTFEDWMKFDLRVGEVLEVEEGKIKVSVGEDMFEKEGKFNVEKGEKIVVGLQGKEMVVPLVNDSVIVPESEIANGSRVG